MEGIIKPMAQNSPDNNRKNNEIARVNEQILSNQVRLILADGNNAGVVSIKEALRQATEAGLDLVEISPNVNPPVCKIIDFGKYKYELQKKKAEAKKKQKVVEVKEIKFTANIGDNDYEVKMRAAKRFLEHGDKVKFTLRFRGREMSYTEQGMSILNRAKEDLEAIAKVELEPKLDGRQMAMLVAPKGA